MQPSTRALGALVILLALPATSCGLEPYIAVFEEWDYEFDDGGIQFTSLDDLLIWVHGHISYTTDSQLWGWTEYWDAPETTFNERKGDCDAYALLFMYFAYSRNLAARPELIAVPLPSGSGHAMVTVGDRYFDPTNGTQGVVADLASPAWFTLSYGKAIYISTNSHNAWRGIDEIMGNRRFLGQHFESWETPL